MGGAELETMLNLIEKTVGGNKMQVTATTMTVGNMVEGEQNVAGNTEIHSEVPVQVLRTLVEAINKNDIKTVESVVETLPADIADVAIAAVNGPLAAASMIARKVAGKWRISRRTGYLKGGLDGEGNS